MNGLTTKTMKEDLNIEFKMNTYSKELMKHFKNPKFVKDIKNPDAIGEVGNIRCGDIMHLEIKVDKDKIKDIGFRTF